MASLATRIRTRIIPAILTAVGVTFLAAGVLSFTSPVGAVPVASPSPSQEAIVDESDEPQITLPPIPTPAPATPTPSASSGPSAPSGSSSPSASPTGPSFLPTPVPTPGERVATRVRIAPLKIDLPVIEPPSGFPPCNVAMFHPDPALGQPGDGKSIYLYAHARTGMFLPLLTASKVSNGKKMLGMIVEVWTGDDQRFLYEITNVYRHQPFDRVFDKPFAATDETLWLQTSEGVGTQPKLLIKALPLAHEAAPHAAAHPKAKPVDCS